MRTKPASIPHAVLTGLLLEELLRDRRYVPNNASQLTSQDELPHALRACAEYLQDGAQWRAWSANDRIWFATARRVRQTRPELDEVDLEVRFYNPDGALAACCVWSRTAAGRWLLLRILDPKKMSCIPRAAGLASQGA